MVVPREKATNPRFRLKKVNPPPGRPLPPEPGEAREIPVRREEIVMVTEPRSQIAEAGPETSPTNTHATAGFAMRR